MARVFVNFLSGNHLQVLGAILVLKPFSHNLATDTNYTPGGNVYRYLINIHKQNN